ncbi:hypothetical protein LCM20_07925 [Halobacillus litoralis]|uniref:hypothetical protein n=1 Tax=Halobacillus litoralis TaxID=45668 RepID=UPI001CD69F0F|nr:hypothetical protein [Halobacillus litoralis]MCA0970509.1 hypothetical protein [Halobacillus litoralis]
MSKWSLYQVLGIILLVAAFILFDWMAGDFINVLASMESEIGMQLFVGSVIYLLVSFNYLMLYWQMQKKDSAFFDRPVWEKGPLVFGVMEGLLIVLFLWFGLAGDPVSQQWLVHAFLVLFISVTYLLIVSIVSKYVDKDESVIKSSYAGTVVFLIVAILLV